MNTIVAWDPLRELNFWNARLARAFGTEISRRRETEESLGSWMPPVDIAETKDKLTLRAELPGFKEDQVELTVEDGVLTLRGERKFEKDAEEENYHRVERSYGTFVRSFTLPTNVDQSRIEARFADGILSVELPRREEARPKQIKIAAGPGTKDAEVKKAK